MRKLALLLIAVWTLFVLNALRLRRVSLAQQVSQDEVNAVAVLGAANEKSGSKQFTGGYLRAVMGGAELNLADAQVGDRPAVLEATIIMGGAELQVPRGWKLRLDLNPVLGGVDDGRLMPQENEADQPDLVVTGTLLLGGLSISEPLADISLPFEERPLDGTPSSPQGSGS